MFLDLVLAGVCQKLGGKELGGKELLGRSLPGDVGQEFARRCWAHPTLLRNPWQEECRSSAPMPRHAPPPPSVTLHCTALHWAEGRHMHDSHHRRYYIRFCTRKVNIARGRTSPPKKVNKSAKNAFIFAQICCCIWKYSQKMCFHLKPHILALILGHMKYGIKPSRKTSSNQIRQYPVSRIA